MRFSYCVKHKIKMLLYVLATTYIVSARGYNVHDDKNMILNSKEIKLHWPERYTAKATSYSLTHNLVEDFSAWRTERKSRVDYNQGAVKVITTLPPDEYSYNAQKFQIYPKMTKKGGSIIECKTISDTSFIKLDQIFPALYGAQPYKVVGSNVTIGETETVKFENNYKNSYHESRKTIWAFHVDGHGWFPVRYEKERYNVKTGFQKLHEIWTFSDCSVEVNDLNFDASLFDCDTTEVLHTPDSEKITKELLFINPNDEKHIDHIYNHFQNKYERKFNHKDEQAMRKDIFRENMRMISSVNRRNLGYKLGVNEFADWTTEELERSHGEIQPPEGLTASVPFPYNESEVNNIASKLPKQYDMRFYGLISPVKYQGRSCGSCWTFAATAVTESALARIKGGKVLALSNQAMMDCANRRPNSKERNGCHGGWDNLAYNFIMGHGLPTEEEYGLYKEKDGFCRIKDMNKTYVITGYNRVPRISFNAMKVAVAKHGPLYISLHASSGFHFYSSGIFKPNKRECPATPKTHAVALIGYGERDGNLFWILKNSWGTSWGMDGYMLIAARDNICGVADKPSYPVFHP